MVIFDILCVDPVSFFCWYSAGVIGQAPLFAGVLGADKRCVDAGASPRRNSRFFHKSAVFVIS